MTVNILFTSDRGIARDVCLSVCLSVSKITQKRVHWFGWNFACRQVSGRGRTDQLLSPIRIVVRMPEVRNRKIWNPKSVKQAPHSEQATGHGMQCREILLLHVVVQGPGNFRGPLTFLCDLRLRSYGASNLPNFRILAFVGGTCAPPSALLVVIIFVISIVIIIIGLHCFHKTFHFLHNS